MCDSLKCGACWNGLPTLYTRRVAGVQESEPSHSSGGDGVERWPFRRKSGWEDRIGRRERVRGWVRANDGYYEVFLYVCVYSRSSRSLWGSGNMRRNRVGEGFEVGARFLNRDCPDVRISENRWIRFKGAAGSPKRSTEKPRDTQCCFGGWVEIQTLPIFGAALEPTGFPRVRHGGRSLQ